MLSKNVSMLPCTYCRTVYIHFNTKWKIDFSTVAAIFELLHSLVLLDAGGGGRT